MLAIFFLTDAWWIAVAAAAVGILIAQLVLWLIRRPH